MTNKLDVLALSEEVARDSHTGKLSRELLTKGQTLYGKAPDFAKHLVRTTPDGKNSLGNWRNGEFVETTRYIKKSPANTE